MMIVGPVGSGKSSLLLGIIGEISLRSGSLACIWPSRLYPRGPMAYFREYSRQYSHGKRVSEDAYYCTLSCCALTRDLELLVAGDETIIGDRGITLSGGQRTGSVLQGLFTRRLIYLYWMIH